MSNLLHENESSESRVFTELKYKSTHRGEARSETRSVQLRRRCTTFSYYVPYGEDEERDTEQTHHAASRLGGSACDRLSAGPVGVCATDADPTQRNPYSEPGVGKGRGGAGSKHGTKLLPFEFPKRLLTTLSLFPIEL